MKKYLLFGVIIFEDLDMMNENSSENRINCKKGDKG